MKDRPTKYFNAVFKVEQDCPPGTVFQADICVCGISLKISRNIPVALYEQGEAAVFLKHLQEPLNFFNKFYIKNEFFLRDKYYML